MSRLLTLLCSVFSPVCVRFRVKFKNIQKSKVREGEKLVFGLRSGREKSYEVLNLWLLGVILSDNVCVDIKRVIQRFEDVRMLTILFLLHLLECSLNGVGVFLTTSIENRKSDRLDVPIFVPFHRHSCNLGCNFFRAISWRYDQKNMRLFRYFLETCLKNFALRAKSARRLEACLESSRHVSRHDSSHDSSHES